MAKRRPKERSTRIIPIMNTEIIVPIGEEEVE